MIKPYLFQSRHSEEMPIQHEQGIPENFNYLISLLYHLDNMESKKNGRLPLYIKDGFFYDCIPMLTYIFHESREYQK